MTGVTQKAEPVLGAPPIIHSITFHQFKFIPARH